MTLPPIPTSAGQHIALFVACLSVHRSTGNPSARSEIGPWADHADRAAPGKIDSAFSVDPATVKLAGRGGEWLDPPAASRALGFDNGRKAILAFIGISASKNPG